MTIPYDLQLTLTQSAPSIAKLTDGLTWFHGNGDTAPSESAVTGLRTFRSDLTIGSVGKRDQYLKTLKRSLHAAMKLEFATIPPYLCALWSIKNELHDVAKSIREIVQEEMLHLALVSNMLASLGEVPKFNTDIPSYPGGLPGGVHPKLVVRLQGFGKAALKTFMQIELPEKILGHGHEPERISEEARTIGRFYSCIDRAFEDLRPTINAENQITGPLANAVIASIDDVHRAIKVIRDQGEGSSESPFDSGLDDLSHYYRFEELYEKRKLQYDPKKQAFYHGEAIIWPETCLMKPTPRGGYKRKDVPPEAWHLLVRFDEVYSQMLDLLQSAWTTGGQSAFLGAIECMFALESHAKPLMQIMVLGERGQTFGPCFRYVKKKDRKFIRDREDANDRKL